jgi:hypothetical protein
VGILFSRLARAQIIYPIKAPREVPTVPDVLTRLQSRPCPCDSVATIARLRFRTALAGASVMPLAASMAKAISRMVRGLPAALRASRAQRKTVPRLNQGLGLQ